MSKSVASSIIDKPSESQNPQIFEDLTLGLPIELELNFPGYFKISSQKDSEIEKYRSIKWGLLNSAGASSLSQTVLVMSSRAKEGKSAIVFNTALSMSQELDWHSIIVDTDDTENSLTCKLGLQQKVGLTDYLLGHASLSDVLYKTTQPKCMIVPAGKRNLSRSELLASKSMKNFMDEIKSVQKHSYIFIDSKNISQFADCKVLAPIVDKILIVIESGRTPRFELNTMVNQLPKDKLSGVVLSQDLWA